MDVRQHNIISYLDLNTKFENEIQTFSIFKKPTLTDNIIHANSQHSVNQN